LVLGKRNFSSILNKILQKIGWSDWGAVSNISQAETLLWQSFQAIIPDLWVKKKFI
jgi:hypothetical protein